MSLLEIRRLRTVIRTPDGEARVVDGVDLTVGRGEAVGLVGESGSGKTALALSILNLLPRETGRILPGSSIRLRGEELLGMGERGLRRIRGGAVAMVFQEPMTALNPVFTVGDQIGEVLRAHGDLAGAERRAEVVRLLREVGIPDPEERAGAYPHQLSGGMRQRAAIAMALAGRPDLLIADEPTSALDVSVQAQILDLLKRLQARHGMALLLISHDLEAVARVCRRMAVFYAGKVMEAGPAREVLARPKHPYTRGLLGSRLSLQDRRQHLRPIPGEVPEPESWPEGCRFHPRCAEAWDLCRREEPGLHGMRGSAGGEPPPDGAEAGEGTSYQRCWLATEDRGGVP
jgi:peptide/nickel transport system ATP-binding protein